MYTPLNICWSIKYYNLEYPRLIDLKDIEVKVYSKYHMQKKQKDRIKSKILIIK